MSNEKIKKPSQAWHQLRDLCAQVQDQRIDTLLAQRSCDNSLHVEHHGLFLDLSKNCVNHDVISALADLFNSYHSRERLQALYEGTIANATENRPALHTALRAALSGHQAPYADTIRAQHKTVAALATRLHQGTQLGYAGTPIRDVVNIGIGGSDLGPRMATCALAAFQQGPTRVHFVSSLDSTELNSTLAQLSPQSTLFLISSKSFSTEETLHNAQQAITWFREHSGQQPLDQHVMAITGNAAAASALGIAQQHIFAVPEWVGGRYSLWSAIGLPVMIAIGVARFEEMLAGAYAMDEHARQQPFISNMPAMMAGIEIWNSTILGYGALAIIPYSHPLRLLPAYLQQLIMESNGKRCRRDGTPVTHTTAPLIWGTAGTEGQHSYHQWLHQGTEVTPVDFILPLGAPDSKDHARLTSHCIAQSKALMEGKTESLARQELMAQGMPEKEARQLAPHKAMPGNRPSNTLMMDSLTPTTLGALLALYEHKTFFTSVLWDINAFDQWGVELGKQLSRTVMTQLSQTTPPDLDSSSNALITRARNR